MASRARQERLDEGMEREREARKEVILNKSERWQVGIERVGQGYFGQIHR